MINKTLEIYYDIFLNIFFGVIIILIIYNLYDKPRIITVESNKNNEHYENYKNYEHFNNLKGPCTRLNIH